PGPRVPHLSAETIVGGEPFHGLDHLRFGGAGREDARDHIILQRSHDADHATRSGSWCNLLSLGHGVPSFPYDHCQRGCPGRRADVRVDIGTACAAKSPDASGNVSITRRLRASVTRRYERAIFVVPIDWRAWIDRTVSIVSASSARLSGR